MTDLLQLAERCEQMPPPSDGTKDLCGHGRLEQEIYAVVRPPIGECPKYTRSLDAAMTLVPEGWCVHWWSGATDNHQADIRLTGGGLLAKGCAKKDAIALCAAALRARAAQATEIKAITEQASAQKVLDHTAPQIEQLHELVAQQASEIVMLREAAKNASGLLDNPIMRRKLADHPLYSETVDALRAALNPLGDKSDD